MSTKAATGAHRSLKRKTASRLAAIMALYRQHFRDAPLSCEAVLEEAASTHINQHFNHEIGLEELPENALLASILEQAVTNHGLIDGLIEGSLGEKWHKERLGPLLESILQAGVAELMIKPDSKRKIIINEYVSLTNEYFDDPELGFVNGVLATIATTLHGNNE